MSVIFLLGYMGAGKTTLGRAVAAAADLDFVDLDSYIEQRAGMSVSEIFATFGEGAFRDLETESLRRIASSLPPCEASRHVIVACGGGTPCRPGNMEIMNRTGLTVALDASLPKLVARLSAERSKRPLIAHLDSSDLERFIVDALRHRSPHYAKAKERFNADNLDTPGQIARSVAQFIDRFLKN